MVAARKRLGEIFIENGTISEVTLKRALERALKQEVKLGYVLEKMGVVTSEELVEALAAQFGYRRAGDLDRCTFSPELLGIIPVDTALRSLIFPLGLEHDILFLAVADPTEKRIISNIAQNHGVTVVQLLATKAQVLSAINKHYLGKDGDVGAQRTVLVAEDSRVTGELIKKTLTRANYHVLLASDGIQAFKMALSEAPDVIITDKSMPNFGGYRLLESMQGMPDTRDIPVILLTESTNSEEEGDAFKKGFFDFLSKPVREAALIARVNRALEAHDEALRSRC
jgi:CheY-like chemotaxis protein